MRVLLSTYGSRGDVQPVIALAVALKAQGAEAIVCAPADKEFVELADYAGVPLAPAFSPVREWVSEALTKKNVDVRTRASEIVPAQYKAISEAAEGCDLILATSLFPSTAAAKVVADKMKLPYVYGAYCPYFVPSHFTKPHSFPGFTYPPEVTDSRELWELNIDVMNQVFGEGVNKLRESVGLALVDNVRDDVFTDRIWLAADPTLAPWTATDMIDVVQTGAWLLPDERPLPADLQAFLEAGEPPVYVGFGSLPAPKDAAEITTAAIRAQGRRVLFAHGWADLNVIDNNGDCFAVGEVNQQALFPRVAAVIHHGGAGTTHTAARAGAPQIVVPQIADQPYWASRVAALGIGVAHEGATPTLESLSAALRIALAPETKANAAKVSNAIRTDGALAAAKMLLAAAK